MLIDILLELFSYLLVLDLFGFTKLSFERSLQAQCKLNMLHYYVACVIMVVNKDLCMVIIV